MGGAPSTRRLDRGEGRPYTRNVAGRRAATLAAVLVAWGLAPVPAGAAVDAGDVLLASTSAAGVKGDNDSTAPSLSADGTRVAFVSDAANLHPADQETDGDVYLKDLVSGDITLASTSTTGVKGDGDSGVPSLSADGTRVAFASQASNLHPGDTDAVADIFVKDLVTGELTLVSTSTAGVKSNGISADPVISDDGSKVAFASQASNLHAGDTDSNSDVYVKDLATGTLTLASTSALGVKGDGDSLVPVLSGDGSRVAFATQATNFDPGDTDEIFDVYVKDLSTGTLTLASTSAAKGNGDSAFPSLSVDGTRVAFESVATNLDPADTDAQPDIYVKDIVTGALLLASTSTSGVKAATGSGEPALWADGSRVGFTSLATNLHPDDTDSFADLYLKDLATGGLVLMSTAPSGAKGDSSSFLPSFSADGATVAFGSLSTNLHPGDTDPVDDVYVKGLSRCGGAIVTINTGTGDDLVVGTAGGDVIVTGTGADIVLAGGGADIVCGEAGNDTLTGGAGNDELYGGAGRDTLNGGSGADELNGGTDLDLLNGDAGNDTLRGGAGNDSLWGAAGVDSLHGGPGNDTLDGGANPDALRGDAGNDVLTGGPGADLLLGGAGNDELRGGTSGDIVEGEAGADTLYGDAGNDILDGGTGKDEARGGDGLDTVHGRGGADKLWGNAGHDTINGGAGPDTLNGGGGKDTLTGGGGTDTCTGGGGIDTAKTCETLVGIP